jgi:hypothetical protein
MATVTGYQIREAIRQWELQKETATRQFNESLWVFEGEEKPAPEALHKLIADAEEAIANLQFAQTRYNLEVTIAPQGREMTLTDGVKRVGGAGRLEKLWRTVASDTGRSGRSYGLATNMRDKDQVMAKRSISVNDSLVLATKAAAYAGALRAAIAQGNTTAVDADKIGLDTGLLS